MPDCSSIPPSPVFRTMSSASSQQHVRRHSCLPSTGGTGAPELSPPAYRANRSNRRSGRRHSQLPAYSQAVELDLRQFGASGREVRHGESSRAEHEFHLVSGGENDGRPWATLRVFSRASSSPQKAPRFLGGDAVTGCVELDLDKSQTINAITLSLRGRFITSFLEEGSYTFLDQTVTIWNKDAGDPREAHPSPLDFDRGKKSKFNARLKGKYSWPFSLQFPTEIFLPQRNGGVPQQVVQTPQSFLERGINANIQYHLVMHVTHGLFRANSKLQAGISYAPTTAPGPASFLRQQAYHQGGFLLPPSEDPTGWHTLSPHHFQRRSGNTLIDMLCTLSVAQPLSYTRGTVIPCFLTLSSTPPLTVDLASLVLSSENPMFTLLLQRRITYIQDGAQALARAAAMALNTDARSVGTLTSTEDLGKAVWWRPPSMPADQSNGLCGIEGEIHLTNDLQPSCQVGFFSVEYFVVLIANQSLQSAPSSPSSTTRSSSSRHHPASPQPSHSSSSSNSSSPVTVATCPVQIATFHLHGPLPTPFTRPPNPDHPSGRHLGSYGSSAMMRSKGIHSSEIQEMETYAGRTTGTWGL